MRDLHRRQPALGDGGGFAGPYLRLAPADAGHDRIARRSRRRGCVPPQRPLPRQHPPGRSRGAGAGLHRRRALLHRLRQGPSGGHRQQHPDHLSRRGEGRVRGRLADLPLRPRAAGLRDGGRRDPHVPAQDSRARAVVRRLPGRAGRGAHRRAAPEGALRQVRQGHDQDLHPRVVRLFGAPHGAGDPGPARGRGRGGGRARSLRAVPAGRNPDQGRGSDRPRCGPDHHRPARQHRLRRLRP